MINERGGVLGSQISLVKADAPDASSAESEANVLITQDQVPIIIGTYASALAMAASPVAERNHKIYWEVVAGSGGLTSRGFKYFFRTSADAATLGAGAINVIQNLVAPKIGKDPRICVLCRSMRTGLMGPRCRKSLWLTLKI